MVSQGNHIYLYGVNAIHLCVGLFQSKCLCHRLWITWFYECSWKIMEKNIFVANSVSNMYSLLQTWVCFTENGPHWSSCKLLMWNRASSNFFKIEFDVMAQGAWTIRLNSSFYVCSCCNENRFFIDLEQLLPFSMHFW